MTNAGQRAPVAAARLSQQRATRPPSEPLPTTHDNIHPQRNNHLLQHHQQAQRRDRNLHIFNDHPQHHHQQDDNDDDYDDVDEDVDDQQLLDASCSSSGELLSEALLAVASAEEYAAKIVRLQQACLTPLKDDLADWLNKILNVTTVTADNFMSKLDNGVIICRLATLIDAWCQDQAKTKLTHQKQEAPIRKPSHGNRATSLLKLDQPYLKTQSYYQTPSTKLSASTLSVQFKTSTQGTIRWDQTKIWEDAKCRTFYARDNVSNFIKWSKEFGVNQSVLFESDDLVLNANPRQVVLCLLEVARIACVKHGFTEAPGLVKFEQEIDRGLTAKLNGLNLPSANNTQLLTDGYAEYGKTSDKTRVVADNEDAISLTFKDLAKRTGNIGGTTDGLIMRYCLHKEEEAARKKAKLKDEEDKKSIMTQNTHNIDDSTTTMPMNSEESQSSGEKSNIESAQSTCVNADNLVLDPDSLLVLDIKQSADTSIKSSSVDSSGNNKNANLSYDSRVDSLDSGEGRTESASTSHSRTPPKVLTSRRLSTRLPSIKRAESSASSTSSSIDTSELSSSRSSLLSGQESTSTKRDITSELDGKVMRIAKSYYGKGATKGVTRLSEGKYKIADRIVFVRLLKGSRVMVRIGGGWDTLENFLFRHKSDPSQVIDVDNLVPLETKLTLDKSPQLTPTNSNKLSKIPYHTRSNSASSTNLSMSNLSVSNFPASNPSTPTHTAISRNTPKDRDTPHRQRINSLEQNIPYLYLHRTPDVVKIPQPSHRYMSNESPLRSYYKRISTTPSRGASLVKVNNRPLGNSRIPTASATNLSNKNCSRS